MGTDPCQAARSIIRAALATVAAADGCRLCLICHPEMAHLVEACTHGGVATRLEAVPDDASALRQALEQCQRINLPERSEEACALVASTAPLLDAPARSLLLAPLHAGATTLGVLALQAAEPQAFTPQDELRIQDVSAAGAQVLQQWARLLRTEAENQDALAVLEALNDGVVVLDGEGRIVRINRALAALGLFDDGALTLPCAPDDPRCPPLLQALLQPSGGSVLGPYEVTLLLPSGARQTLRVTPSPLERPQGGEVRVVRDVSMERKATETYALFISQVAHELRGPLQHIMGFTSLIRDIDDLPRESYGRFFGHIKDEADHLARLVDDLVELLRIEVGRFAVRPELARIDTLVANVMERVRPRIVLRGLSLTLQLPPEPMLAQVDPLRITQVINNLVENALKFAPAGGTIAVSVHPDGDHHVVVSVADTGPGIPSEAMDHLFQRFFQGHGDANRSTSGMGLGLYTCREIITAHGGEIWAESEYGAGSTFRFRLPRATP
jgi:signal transduction histidine kinase